MEATGVVRKVDELGRIVIPKEMRKILHIENGDAIEIFSKKDGEVLIRKFRPFCVFCGNPTDDMKYLDGHGICQACRNAIAEL